MIDCFDSQGESMKNYTEWDGDYFTLTYRIKFIVLHYVFVSYFVGKVNSTLGTPFAITPFAYSDVASFRMGGVMPNGVIPNRVES